MQIHNSTKHTACHKLTKHLKVYVSYFIAWILGNRVSVP